MNTIVRFVAPLIATTFLLLGSTQVRALSPVLPMIEYVTSDVFIPPQAPICPTTGCRYVPVPTGWQIPAETFATYPQFLRDAVPSRIGTEVLDFLATFTGPQWRRSDVQFLAYRDGTPGTVRMHKGMFLPEFPATEIISHVFFAEGTKTADGTLLINVLREQPWYTDEGFGGWSVAMPVTLPDGSMACRSGETELLKVYNNGVNKPLSGGRNDGNHRYLTNQELLRKQSTVPGWETSYVDDVYCVPEQTENVMVGHHYAFGSLEPGEIATVNGVSSGHYQFITKVNVGGTAPPKHFLSTVLPAGRIGYDASTGTTAWGEGAWTAQAKNDVVVEFGRPADVIVSGQVDESTGFVYYQYANVGGGMVPDVFFREAGALPLTFKIGLSNQTAWTPNQWVEFASDMVLYVRTKKVNGKVIFKRSAVVTLRSYLLDGLGSNFVGGFNRGHVVMLNLDGETPVMEQYFSIQHAPSQITIDETTGAAYIMSIDYLGRDQFDQSKYTSTVVVIKLFTGMASEIAVPWPTVVDTGFPTGLKDNIISGLKVDSKLGRLYATSELDYNGVAANGSDRIFDSLYVRDLHTNSWIGEVQVGHGPGFLDVGSRDGTNFLYINNHRRIIPNDSSPISPPEYGMSEVNPNTLSVRRIETGERVPHGIAIAPQH